MRAEAHRGVEMNQSLVEHLEVLGVVRTRERDQRRGAGFAVPVPARELEQLGAEGRIRAARKRLAERDADVEEAVAQGVPDRRADGQDVGDGRALDFGQVAPETAAVLGELDESV